MQTPVWAVGQESEQGTQGQKEVTDVRGRRVRSWSSVLPSLDINLLGYKVAGVSLDPFPRT